MWGPGMHGPPGMHGSPGMHSSPGMQGSSGMQGSPGMYGPPGMHGSQVSASPQRSHVSTSHKFYIPDEVSTSDMTSALHLDDSKFVGSLSPSGELPSLDDGESAEDMLKDFLKHKREKPEKTEDIVKHSHEDIEKLTEVKHQYDFEIKEPKGGEVESDAEKMLKAFKKESPIKRESFEDLREELEEAAEKRKKEEKKDFERWQDAAEDSQKILEELHEKLHKEHRLHDAAEYRNYEASSGHAHDLGHEHDLMTLRKKQLKEQQEAVEKFNSEWKCEKESLLQAWREDHERLQHMIRVSNKSISPQAIGKVDFQKALANITPEKKQTRTPPPASSPPKSAHAFPSNRAPSISPASASRPPRQRSVSMSPHPSFTSPTAPPPPAQISPKSGKDDKKSGDEAGAGKTGAGGEKDKAATKSADKAGDKTGDKKEEKGFIQGVVDDIKGKDAPEHTELFKQIENELWTTPQVFVCIVGHPGVGYRFTPSFADKDKNKDNRGPRCTLEDGKPIQSVRCVIGTEFVKSKEGVTFLKCSTGRGWLPLHTSNGTQDCFKHLGAEGEVDTSNMRFKRTLEESAAGGEKDKAATKAADKAAKKPEPLLPPSQMTPPHEDKAGTKSADKAATKSEDKGASGEGTSPSKAKAGFAVPNLQRPAKPTAKKASEGSGPGKVGGPLC